MNRQTRSPLFLIAAASLALWSFAYAGAQIIDQNNVTTSGAEPIAALANTPTIYTWSASTTGFAWLNASHWTGHAGHYPGVDANANSPRFLI
jgi:hypothetical protein